MKNRSTETKKIVPSQRTISIREALEPLLKNLSKKPETLGVCVLGSYAFSGLRPSSDLYSDFDVGLFLDVTFPDEWVKMTPQEFQLQIQPLLPDWLPNFKFVYPGIDPDAGQNPPPLQINVHQLVVQYEEQQEFWPPDRREAFANTCDVYFDPTGRVQKLIDTKSAPPIADLKSRIRNNLALIPVTLEHSVEKSAIRGSLGDATLALAEVVSLMLDLAYAINRRDVPHGKWRHRLLDTLAQIPNEFAQQIDDILRLPNASESIVLEKLKLMLKLLEQLKQLVPPDLTPAEDPYRVLVSQVRPGFQLKHLTHADKSVNKELDQYAKMAMKRWNQINFDLLGDE